MTNEEIMRFFNDIRAFIQGNRNLHEPRVAIWFGTYRYFRDNAVHAIFPGILR